MAQEFKAKLKIPKRELWLGCIVSEAIDKGYGIFIRFSNCPLSMFLSYREASYQGWRPLREPQAYFFAGLVIDVEARWRKVVSRTQGTVVVADLRIPSHLYGWRFEAHRLSQLKSLEL